METGIIQGNSQTEHNYGIDILRILSMFMIVVLHVLGQGGILVNAKIFSANYEIAWLMDVLCYCAVNCFAIISGYVSYGRKHKYSNIIYLYFQVLFYTIIATVVFAIVDGEKPLLGNVIEAIFPFAFNTYWYFSAYFVLFFIMPFLNEAISKFERSTLRKLLITLAIVFSILPTLFYSDFGYTEGGYSFLWLAIMYVVGAYIKKYDVTTEYANWKNLLVYLIAAIVSWASRWVIELLTTKLYGTVEFSNYLIGYASPTIVICAVFLFLFFKKVAVNRKVVKVVSFFAPVAFGVYLFHEEPIIAKKFIIDAFIKYSTYNPIVMILCVLGTALAIWLIGSLIDRLRLVIFDALKIKKLSASIETGIVSVVGKCKKKFVKKVKD